MKLTTILLIVTLMAFLSVTDLEARRKYRKKYWYNNVHENFEIYHPKGLTVWYPKLRGMVRFGVQVFLNQRHRSDSQNCDICFNTSQAQYGKFIIRDENAFIRPGDTLQYTFQFYMSNGTIFEMKSEFYVSANRVLQRQYNDSTLQRDSVTTVSPITGTDESKIAMYEENITMLESIVSDVFYHCNNVIETTKNLYLNVKPTTATGLDSKQLYESTLNVLQKVLPKINWKSVMVNAFYYNDGLGFEVTTLIDKLKILHLSKTIADSPISDMDNINPSTDAESATDDYNDITFHDVKVANKRI